MQFVCGSCLANVFLIVVLSNSLIPASMVSSSSVVVALGAGVTLNCSIKENDSVTWTYTSWNSSKEANIYLGKDILQSMRLRYKIDKSISGHHNLIIDSVDWDHAGRYQCTSTMQQSLMNDIQLTVLGSYPVCAAHISKEDGKQQTHLTILCSINYTGNVNPVFSWTKGTEQNFAVKAITNYTSRAPFTKTSSIIEQQLHANDSGVTFQCRITLQLPNNSQGNVYEYTWNYTLSSFEKSHTFQCTTANIYDAENITITIQGRDKDFTGAQDSFGFPITALAIGGSLLFFLLIAISVSCVVHRKRLKDDTCDRPDVALHTDLNSYDEIAISSDRSPNYILEEDRFPGRSDGRTIVDNVVYSEVCTSKDRSNVNNGGNLGENSRSLQTQTRERKNLIGADGTEYAELSGVKPPACKREVPKPPAYSRVEVYASIDHNGRAPPPPPKL